MGCHFLLQGIFPTHGLNPHLLCLLHCRQILYLLSHLGSPRYNLELCKNYPELKSLYQVQFMCFFFFFSDLLSFRFPCAVFLLSLFNMSQATTSSVGRALWAPGSPWPWLYSTAIVTANMLMEARARADSRLQGCRDSPMAKKGQDGDTA